MAIVTIIVDTEKATIGVDVNGKKLKDVKEARAYLYTPYDSREDDGPEAKVEVIGTNEDEENGVRVTQITCIGKEKEEITETSDASLMTTALASVLFQR